MKSSKNLVKKKRPQVTLEPLFYLYTDGSIYGLDAGDIELLDSLDTELTELACAAVLAELAELTELACAKVLTELAELA